MKTTEILKRIFKKREGNEGVIKSSTILSNLIKMEAVSSFGKVRII